MIYEQYQAIWNNKRDRKAVRISDRYARILRAEAIAQCHQLLKSRGIEIGAKITIPNVEFLEAYSCVSPTVRFSYDYPFDIGIKSISLNDHTSRNIGISTTNWQLGMIWLGLDELLLLVQSSKEVIEG